MMDFVIENGVLVQYSADAAEVSVPEGVSVIGEKAFSDCKTLTSITLPEGVTFLDRSAFASCVNLTEAHLPKSLETIGEFAFYNCGFTDLPKIPGVKRLMKSAFSKSKGLTKVTVYEGIETLERGVFFGCPNLVEVTLPKDMKSVDKDAFLESDNLSAIRVAQDNPYFSELDGILYSKDGKTLVICPNSLTKVVIPEGVEAIGPNAFAGNRFLEEVTLPSTLKTIGHHAFSGCFKLSELEYPASLETIEEAAFESCRRFKHLIFSDDLKEIRGGAFFKAWDLQWIRIPEDIEFDLHWFVDPNDSKCWGADQTSVPFVTNRPFEQIASNMGRHYASFGYILADIANIEIRPEIAEGYRKYIKENLEAFHDDMLGDVEILQWMFDHDMITQDMISPLLGKASVGGYTAASAALLDYQSKTFQPKDSDSLLNMQFDLFEDALSL